MSLQIPPLGHPGLRVMPHTTPAVAGPINQTNNRCPNRASMPPPQELQPEVGDCARHLDAPGPAELESAERRVKALLEVGARQGCTSRSDSGRPYSGNPMSGMTPGE
jgi:hypothetical protein